jgi:2-methylcitrate dehydratase PrpD
MRTRPRRCPWRPVETEGLPTTGIRSAAPITAEVAEFAVSVPTRDIPSAVLELGGLSILDGLGLAISGSVSTQSALIRASVAARLSTEDASVVIGTGFRGSADVAALLNGVSMHVDDFDDIQLAAGRDRVYGLLMHPTAPVLAATLAVAERDRLPGAALLRGYHVGVEVACKIAEAIAPRHYEAGFHTTGTCGTIGATAGVASLLGLPIEETRHALGISASHAAGLRASFGTMTKALHAGRAAEHAVASADLAVLGWTAATDALEAPQGFFAAAGGGAEARAIMGRLGEPWTFADPGIAIKPYPCASLTHPAIGMTIDLARQHDLRSESVEQIRVGANSRMPTALIYPRPRSALEAKFSMEYCVATALLRRRVGLADFEASAIARPDVRALSERVTFEVDPRADEAGLDRMTTFLSIETIGGSSHQAREDYPRGTPANPLSFQEVVSKFGECGRYGGFEESRLAHVVDEVGRLETMTDVTELTAHLRRTDSGEGGEP